MNFFPKIITTVGVTLALSLSAMEAKADSDLMANPAGWQNLYIGVFSVEADENSVGSHCHYSGFNLQYNKIDLNSGSGDSYIYLCGGDATSKWDHRLNRTDARVTDLGFIVSNKSKNSTEVKAECASYYGGGPWFTGLQDLNDNAGGDFIYLCYQAQPGKAPITKINISARNKKSDSIATCLQGASNIVIDTDDDVADLNSDAGGDWITVCKE